MIKKKEKQKIKHLKKCYLYYFSTHRFVDTQTNTCKIIKGDI